MIRVEPAAPADLSALSALDRLVIGSSERRSLLTSAMATGNCAKALNDENEVVGFMIYEKTFHGHLFISFLIVHPGHRREGIAKALIKYAEAHAPTDMIFTSTNRSNLEMQRLCETHGFIRSNDIEVIDDEDPEIVYYKIVKTPRAPAAAPSAN